MSFNAWCHVCFVRSSRCIACVAELTNKSVFLNSPSEEIIDFGRFWPGHITLTQKRYCNPFGSPAGPKRTIVDVGIAILAVWFCCRLFWIVDVVGHATATVFEHRVVTFYLLCDLNIESFLSIRVLTCILKGPQENIHTLSII